ncbi:MAG: prolyl oligopeptidase family serine peptidase [Flavobacteriales bacterium]
MKHLFLGIVVLLAGQAFSQRLSYPLTNKVDQTDLYHGHEIADPYRWLEDDNSEATKAWVITQNELTRNFMQRIPYRDKIRDRLKELINYPRYSLPSKAGDFLVYAKNDGLQNQAVYYREHMGINSTEVLLDPNQLSLDGTVSVSIIGYSQDKKYLNYLLSKSGSDWQEMRIMEVANGRTLDDKIEWVKFTGAAWWGDGFFYARYPKPEAGKELTAKSENHAIYYHALGDDQSKDKLIYEDRENPLRYHSLALTEDRRYALLYISRGTDGSDIMYAPMKDLESLKFKPLITGFDHRSSVVDNEGDRFLVRTDIGAPNYRLVMVDPLNPARDRWTTIIPEEKFLLESVNPAGGRLFVKHMRDVAHYMSEYNRDGKKIKDIPLPAIGSVSGFAGEKESKVLFFMLNSHTAPPMVYEYEISSGKMTPHFKTEAKKSEVELVSEQVFFNSKDGTRIPMFLIYRKGLKKDGQRPVMLYGYGGFNISLTPSYDAFTKVIAENDGIYAIVNLRGGGEYGEEWHKAGMKNKKQNVFDDFISAAEWLIEQGYTNTGKLGIYGRSNGGLLVGAAMTQRPELFKVAFPAVGVLDMLRFHKFTVGWGWVGEYGSSDNADDFKFLIKYSPLHNIRQVAHPATMVLTSDHDDRVVPSHSFKFAATLQENDRGNNPQLIRIETGAGHGAGTALSKAIETTADMYAFFFHNTNSTVKY